MTQALVVEKNSIDQFKDGVDALLQKRDYFMQKILPKLKEGVDYYIIKNRKSLGKSGAEALASIYGLSATFEQDTETLSAFKGADGLVALKCKLSKNGEFVGEGRGCATLKQNGGDYNKAIKMCQKSAFVDSVLRVAGISSIFSQDMECMDLETISSPVQDISVKSISSPVQDTSPSSFDDWYSDDVESPYSQEEIEPIPSKKKEWSEDRPMTAKQRSYLTSLINEQITDPNERERFFEEMENCDRAEASELISSFTMSSRC